MATLGHSSCDPVLAAHTGLAPVVVGADPAGYPEHPPVESYGTRPVDIDAADGPHHGFAHCVLHLTGADPPDDEGPQAGVQATVQHLPSGAVSGAGGGDKGRLVKLIGLAEMSQKSEMRQSCVKWSFA
jgi:hypothetical protein